MTPIELTVLIFGSMLAMMAIRLPIAVSMFCAGASYRAAMASSRATSTKISGSSGMPGWMNA